MSFIHYSQFSPPSQRLTTFTSVKHSPPKMRRVMSSSFVQMKKLVDDEDDTYTAEVEDDAEEETEDEGERVVAESKKKKWSGGKPGRGGSKVAPPCCMVEKCESDLSGCKMYHQKNRVCEVHAKAQVVWLNGMVQRFCQQCSRFHDISEFDDTKRSCRKRLAGHNERRRKSFLESHNQGSSRRRNKANQHRQVDERSESGSPENQDFHML